MEVPLAPVAEIPEDGLKTVDFFGREVHLLRVEGQPKAVMNVCMHLGGPLHREGDQLVCEWHKAAFAVDSGRRLEGPAAPGARLMVLPTRVIAGVLTYVYADA